MTESALSRQAWVVRSISVIVALSGLLAIDRPLAQRVPGQLESFLMPFGLQYASRALDVLLGVTLLYLAVQLWQRKLVAWWVATGATSVLLGSHLLTGKGPAAALYFALTLVVLLSTKEYFLARSEIISIQRGVIMFLASIGLAVAYGTLGFLLLDQRDFGITFQLQDAVIRSLREYFLIGNPDIVPYSRHTDLFLDSLGFLGAASFIFGLYSLFRPLAYEYSDLPLARRRMADLLEHYSTSTDDFFKLWPHDKSYFFGQEAGIAYGVAAGAAITVGDPVGAPAGIAPIIQCYSDMCLTHGWEPCFMYVNDLHRADYKDMGFELLKVGEDAVVSLENFTAITATNKHFRNVRNRFEKDGYVFSVSLPPHNWQLLQEAAQVSAEWLKQPGRKEWKFLSGNFSPRYLERGPLYVVQDSDGRVQAFANGIPSYMPEWATIDLMRYREEAPKNVMDFLLMQIMLKLPEQGYKKFNLGLAPLSGLAQGESAPEEKLLNLVYRSNQKYVSFQGLRQFKDKFEPVWESKYLAYRGGIGSLPKIAFALNKLMRR